MMTTGTKRLQSKCGIAQFVSTADSLHLAWALFLSSSLHSVTPLSIDLDGGVNPVDEEVGGEEADGT